MADEKQRGKGAPGDEFGDFDEEVKARPGGAADEGGLGNLPPLSDFESDSSRGLPPMGEDSGGRFDSGLPPLGEIHPEVPRPTGGNVRPAPPGFEKSAFDTPISDSGLDTPQTPRSTSFQDLTTDSDFSPETPEIGPGPDSDLETPMFDSAFGPGSAFDRTPDTSAPTQAMETPMFGDRSRSSGFDADAFGVSSGARAGTPIPDFSPDTGMPGRVPPPPPMMTPPPMAAESGSGAGKLIVGAIVGLLIGAGAGLFLVEKVPFAPATGKIASLESAKQSAETKASSLEAQIREMAAKATPTDSGQPAISVDDLTAQIKQLQDQLTGLQGEVAAKTNDRDLIQGDIEKLNQDYAKAQGEFEDLRNQNDIERARSAGLAAEVTRLQSQVGGLEEAATRAQSVKKGLADDVNRLEVVIQESSRLAPAKYSYEQRLADVQALKADLARSNVVTPELMERYAQLQERENQISKSREYFFARIPVKDRYGVTHEKWAEALMNGNWSVYFRSLDGKSIGIYEKVSGTNPPQYNFRQFLSPAEERTIEEQIISARTPGYEAKISELAQREVTMEDRTGLQRVFDSL